MLGNFSIGDYFKKEAIDFAWELLTDEKWFAFDKDKLYITVHDHDEEAYNYWVDVIGVDPSHVPAAPSGTATLLRLSPSHQFYPRAILAVTHFRYPRLPWLDGRCVQGPGTYSPRRG